MNDELKNALTGASWQEVVDWAKSNGYDPLKEEKVIKQRDVLMSAKAKAEYEAEEKAKLAEAVKARIAEIETALAENKKNYEALVAKLGDNPQGIIEKLSQYEAAEAKRKEKISADLEAEKQNWIKALNIKSEEINDVVPDLGDVERTLEWMNKNKQRLLGDKASPVRVIDGVPQNDNETITNEAKKFAEAHNCSEEAAMRIIKKQREKSKGNQ